ncbi:phosphate-starvation-inducible PsiE family protein [Amphibacillus sp. Q70]|uniref:phosphate-starvation-inducible PsiE family protein n=1 Tax=Amphibacillus sp. Q70 TaxID=3453416 RepID=UPI003F875196
MNEKNKNKTVLKKIGQKFSVIIMGIEVFLAALIIIAVVIGAIALIFTTIQEGVVVQLLDYDNFQKLLSYLLILIIGLELSIMLIKHQPSNIVDVMIYAIARKMLIYSTDMIEILTAVISIGILFIIKVSLKRAKLDDVSAESTKKRP